jgi:hypothetical protein
MALKYSPSIVQDGLVLCLDPSQNKSYPVIDLPVKDGLIMWLDADDDTTFSYSSGTTVSQWRDKSGFNYHMAPVGSAPTRNAFLNSRKVLAFTNTQDIQNGVIDLRTSPYTIFVVDRYTSPSSGTGRILTSNGGYNNWLLGHWASEVNKYYANGWIYSTYVALDTNWKLYLGDWGGPSNDLANFYGAGTAIATNSADASAGPWTLGINANSGERSNCEAAEIIVFNRLLTATERRLVHTYLGQKWGISNTDRTLMDLSGFNDNALFGNGVLANMPAFDYYNKGSLKFTGNFALCPTATVNSLNGDTLTVEAWVKHSSFGGVGTGRGYISNWHSFNVSNQRGFVLRTYDTQTNPSFWWCWGGGNNYDAFGPSSYVMNLNQIYHIVATYEKGVAIKIYINGRLEGTGTNSINNTIAFDTTNGVYIGFSNINSSYMDGNIYIARLYNRALKASEVLQNYEAQKNRFINTIVQQGLVLNLDAGNPYSYAGSGTTWYDVSGNAINASASGTSSYVNSNGGFLSFPNNNSYYNTSTVSALNLGSASFSMECWVYLDAATASDNTYRGIISLGTNASNYVYIAKWRSGLYSGLYVQYVAGAATITGVYQANEYNPVSKWTHVIATKSGSSLTLYVNGSIVYTINDLNTTFTGNSSVYIAQAHGGVASLYGYVGESRVYNISLSAAQVLQNYNATKGRFGL